MHIIPVFHSLIRASHLLIVLFTSLLLNACGTQVSQPSSDSSTTAVTAAESADVNWADEVENELAKKAISQCQQYYLESQQLFNKLKNPTFRLDDRKLMAALNELDIVMSNALTKASLYANVHPNKFVREVSDQCEQNFVGLISDIGLSETLYEKVVSIDTSSFDAIDKRYIEETLKAFRRSGVDLSEDKRKRIKALNEQINKLSQDFYKNVREDVRSMELDSADRLTGLPQDYIDARKNKETGKYVITTNYPDYIPVSQYAKNDDFRKQMYSLFRNRGYPANKKVLIDLLAKRHEYAQLLSYPSYAHYVTEDHMIKTPEKAQDFIDSIADVAKPLASREYQRLLTLLQKTDPQATQVGDWQKGYLAELIKKEQYSIDSQEVRQYFYYDKVRKGIFDLTSTLFNVQIRPWQTQVWHESVEAYEVLDHGKVIGKFFLDMHPRDGKYKHAAAFTFQSGIQGMQLPIKALVCNFPGGAGSDGVMEHAQVETFLHEFGHLLHGIFGGHQRWASQSGIATERDFVEAPSQMLEEWVWNAKTLKSFATNNKGEPIPDHLIKKMRAARDFGRGLFTRHQMFYAALSLNYYDQAPDTFDLESVMQSLQNKYSNFAYVDGTNFQYSFGHLMGYSAVYYTYMWSLVIADDMFSEFENGGLLNKEIANRYRRAVLEPGGSKDAAELVEDFLGRPYSFDAFSKKFK